MITTIRKNKYLILILLVAVICSIRTSQAQYYNSNSLIRSSLIRSIWSPNVTQAQTTATNGNTTAPTTNNQSPTTNITDSSFSLLICDGPELPPGHPNWSSSYRPCNFAGLMKQVIHLINVAFIIGILTAFAGITYAGFLYLKGGAEGNKSDIDKAIGIFKGILYGFIMMFSAWFIIYQLIVWLTGGSSFAVLLGK